MSLKKRISTVNIKEHGPAVHQKKLPDEIKDLIRCPACKERVDFADDQIRCMDQNCGRSFPIKKDIPILINESQSLFSIKDLLESSKARSGMPNDRKFGLIRRTFRRLMPEISMNFKAKQNYARFTELLAKQSTASKVLVLGGATLGRGMDTALLQPSIDQRQIDFVESDVSLGPRTMLICDANDIPFASASFDGVIIQAVLEHVPDPCRCVAEIFRVLKSNGYVYAETPFMQQVHEGEHDFSRFTHLGHRRLFRRFLEVDSGAVAGPGVSLAWSYRYFLLSFTESQRIRRVLSVFARLTSFYLKYFDYYLIDKAGAFDASSAYFFLGKKNDSILTDQELVRFYRGSF